MSQAAQNTALHQVYSAAVKRYAMLGAVDGRLDPADISLQKRNPVCGSQVVFTARLGPPIEVGCDARRACLLTQAATAAMLEGVTKEDHGQLSLSLQHGLDALKRVLMAEETQAEHLPAAWQHVMMFAPAAAIRARHSSILLPFQTGLEACSGVPSA